MSGTALQLEQLPPGLQAVAMQRGEVVLLGPEGKPSSAVTEVSSGWYYTELGHHRLTLAVAQLQADRVAAEARAEALQYALDTRAPPAEVGYGYAAALLTGALLFALGAVVGRQWLSRK